MSRYTEILARLETIFNEEYIAAVLRTTDDEPELPMDILTVVLEELSSKGNEWLCEICFLPLKNAAEGIAYINVSITIKEDMEEFVANQMAWLISRFNHYAPYGAFTIDETGKIFTYKLCCPVDDSGDDEKLFDAANLVVSHALDFAETAGNIMETVIEGEVSPNAALNYFLGRTVE